LDRTGLTLKISDAAISIELGRKGFATRGKADEGRVSFEKGIAKALSAFKEASNQGFAASADPETIILAEYAFISQELEFCDRSDKDSLGSLNLAILRLDDAFLVLKVVEDKTLYKAVESAFAHKREFRFRGLPKDSFHVACGSLKTRLGNILKAPGLDLIEKALLKQRFKNLTAGQGGYIEKQKKALQKGK